MKTCPSNVSKLSATRDKVHPHCFVCGCGDGLKLEFDVLSDGTVRSSFECSEIFEGYAGRLHGGVIAALLDGAMTNCLFSLGITAVTVELVARYRHPVEVGTTATVTAEVERETHGIYYMKASLRQNNKTVATGQGKFFEKNGI